MNLLLIYMVKVAVYLAGFYIIYFIFLSRDTQFIRNRLFMLLSVVAAFIFPFITVNIKEHSSFYYFGKTLSDVFITADTSKYKSFTAADSIDKGFDLIFGIYLAGVICFGLKLLFDLFSLFILISRNKMVNGNIIYFKGFNTPGFSALGNIFINQSLVKNEAEEIIRHEQKHIDNKHFLDILFIETALVFQWFNPFVYLINRSLRALHEYQADEGYLRSGIPVINYQKLLLNHVFRSGRINIYNSFSNPSLIKKRMIMMSKEPSDNSSGLKILFVIPVIALFLYSISACETNFDDSISGNAVITTGLSASKPAEILKLKPYVRSKVVNEIPTEIFVVVEKMPTFPGGDKAMMDYIYSNIKYPVAAKEKSIQGRVILRFAVLANGNVGAVSILKSVDPLLDSEAMRVVKSLPQWSPGMQGGKPVNVWYSVPVTFQLK